MIGETANALRDYIKNNPFMLAPMAGVTDASYREIAYEHGCRRAYTEMVSCAGMMFDSERTWELVEPGDAEAPLGVQIFGSKPEQFAFATHELVSRLGPRLAVVDINMACPVPKVFKKGEGSALMGNPQLALACVTEALKGLEGTNIPLTCKIRSGITQNEELAPTFARMLEEAGAACIAVHGRSASQLYRGSADWGVIARVAKAVGIPVIGSGDVMSASDAVRMLAECGCDGVFIARGSYGNPWIFEDAYGLLNHGALPQPPSMGTRLDVLEQHICKAHGYGVHMARLRPLVGWYIKGLPSATVWRSRSMQCSSFEDYRALIADMRASAAQHGLL